MKLWCKSSATSQLWTQPFATCLINKCRVSTPILQSLKRTSFLVCSENDWQKICYVPDRCRLVEDWSPFRVASKILLSRTTSQSPLAIPEKNWWFIFRIHRRTTRDSRSSTWRLFIGDFSGLVIRIVSWLFSPNNCRRYKVFTTRFIYLRVSGSLDYWFGTTTLYSRKVLCARQKLAAQCLQAYTSVKTTPILQR